MSGADSEEDQVYRLDELDQLPLSELKSLYQKVVSQLKDLKLEFEEFQSKHPASRRKIQGATPLPFLKILMNK